MKKAEKYLIGVYGSLKKGYFNDAYLARSEYVGDVVTEPNYELVDFGPYPAVLEGGSTGIHCEVYKVNKVTLLSIARMEVVAGYEVRVIDTEYGKVCFCVYTHDKCVGYDRVASGEWIPKIQSSWLFDDVAYAKEAV